MSKLTQNTKFISFNGVIGRRDYFLNCIYLCFISLFFVLPLIIWFSTNQNTLSDTFLFDKFVIQNAPISIKSLYTIGVLLIAVPFVSNIVRRLNDIFGREIVAVNSIISLVCLINTFAFIFSYAFGLILNIICAIIGLFLIFKKGKITSGLPYDHTKIFNWGAFFGTWIWGLFNKSYIPLLFLLLFFTPWGIYFQIYCGLKGNEWAYKNKKWEDAEKFNKSQRKQAVFWSIFVSLASALLFVFMVFVSFLTALSTTQNPNLQEKNQFIEEFKKAYIEEAESYFDSYTLDDAVNKFYVNPAKWNNYSFSEKKEVMDIATQIAVNKKMANQNADEKKRISRASQLPVTKIYSSKTSNLLGEFVLDSKLLTGKDSNFKDYFKAAMNAYRFRNDE